MPQVSGETPSVSRAVVVGAGTMGTGIAQVLAAAGIHVTIVDKDEVALARASRDLGALLARADGAGEIETASSVADATADAAVEAVHESLDAKREVFAALDAALGPEALLATNTSSLSVGEIAQATTRPERVVGLHFMNPAPVMKLVEVVRAEASSDEAVERAAALARQIGKTPVVVADRPCFVVNRVLIPMINEAARALESGVADAESIDKAMTLGAGFRMGPLHLADLIGLDVVVAELRELARSLGPAYAPSAELVRRAERGELGRKTGAGFFAYRR